MNKRINLKYSLWFLLPIIIYSCSATKSKNMESYGLKDYFKKDFTMGVAINANQILGKDLLGNPLIVKEYNSITPENIMKSEIIHPEWDKYNFELSDKIVEYGQKNKLKVVGHTLIWHSQLSKFAQSITSKDSLKMFMKEHITTIGKRYDKKIHGWDVINEALEEDGSYRKSIFYKLLGEDYLVEAFRLAQAATPNSQLYYNDYNIEQPKKRQGAINIIKKIQAAGVRIDGVGIQGHWSIKGLPLKEIEDSIIEFSKLGIKVHFTELDVTTLPNPWDLVGADVNQRFENNAKMNPYPDGLPASVQKELAQQYEDLFRLFLKHADKIDRVTFWGLADGNSWLNGWPIAGRTNYPLLFDRNYLPKPAYHSVMGSKGAAKAKEILP